VESDIQARDTASIASAMPRPGQKVTMSIEVWVLIRVLQMMQKRVSHLTFQASVLEGSPELMAPKV